ncbi:MAG TPA: SDR family oxidoreductase [Candidatus Eisenbacteria bacterium]|jgi:NAD(P)-dependent dehydrogenase (short-subunit alcohol dehydrogenase family)|nr:SDR family oxidoreductase [Candidatus Eisenbacteria bacterium]
MSESIQGRVAIITGSTKGIGLGIAKALLAEGARVAISARNAREVDSVSKELGREHMGRVLGKACDVRQEAEVRALFDAVDREWGGLDYLVNNAGIGLFKNVEEISLEEWNSVIETNLTGVFLCTRAAIPRMRKRGSGYIVNISSLAGRNAFPTASAYNTSKFGLNGFSEAVMQEIRYDGIKLSYIMPGSVNTEFGGGKQDPGNSWKVQPEDIAEIVVDLFRHPARSLPSRVEIRPSQPPKK